MKKSFLLCVFLAILSGSAFSQQQISSEFKDLMDHTFENLEKHRVPNGVLLDAAMEFTNVQAFNGTLTDSTFVTMTNFREIYKTLISGRVNESSIFKDTHFYPYDQFNNKIRDSRDKNFISINGLFYEYSKFINGALFMQKLTYSNGQFIDKYINGVWQNPYETKKVFAMTPGVLEYSGLNLNVKVPWNVVFSNRRNNLEQLEIDFDDGQGYRIVNINAVVPVGYTNPGVKTWKYKLTISGGEIFYSHSKIQIKEALDIKPVVVEFNEKGSNRTVSQWVCTGGTNLYNFAAEADIPYMGSLATGGFTLLDAGSDCQITNPLIVAEGFDLGTLLNPEMPMGQTSIETFLESINGSGSADLIQTLQTNEDYDIIYVNWNNGVDYLQRNAYLLEEVIEWVNGNKVGGAQNVVLGQSMGGVIARYALSDMEARGVSHDTRLFISHDAPQQGANIPLGLQFFYRHLSNQYATTSGTIFGNIVTLPLIDAALDGDSEAYTTILDTPAARQLLKTWSTSGYVVDNSVHDAFYDELRSLNANGGYPEQGGIRNISISNGNECGETQNFLPGSPLFSFDFNRGFSFWYELGLLIATPLGGLAGALAIDPDFIQVAFLGLIPGNSRFIVDFEANALSYGHGTDLYYGLVRYKKKILWIFNSQVTITEVNKDQPAGLLPYDSYGGGFYDTSEVADALGTVNNLFIADRFNFIPTVSALDIGEDNVPLNDSDYLRAYIGANPPTGQKASPFDNFTTAFRDRNDFLNNNELHIVFSERNGDWLVAELDNNEEFTDCSAFCNTIGIIGPDVLCTTATYSVPLTNANVFWTATPAAAVNIIAGQGTEEITLELVNGYRTSITISALINVPECGGFEQVTETIWGGKPAAPPSLTGPTEVLTGALVNYEAGVSQGADSYKWWLPGTEEIVTFWDITSDNWQKKSFAMSDRYIEVYTGNGEINGLVQVMGVNACGCGGARSLSVVHDPNGQGGIPFAPPPSDDETLEFYSIYPNPSNTQFNITLLDENRWPNNNTKVYGTLYNIYGHSKRQVELVNNQATVNIAGLQKGVYILQIELESGVEAHQVLID
ncbi:MAG: T9SS type A sorting domain-containing protein [Bacteroidota bacterium]